MKALIETYLNYFKNLSRLHSKEHQVFIQNKLVAHRYYMDEMRLTNPYLNPDTWQDEEVTVIQLVGDYPLSMRVYYSLM